MKISLAVLVAVLVCVSAGVLAPRISHATAAGIAPVCSEGFHQEGTMCVSDNASVAGCAEESTYNTETNMCEYASVAPTCPGGSILMGDSCMEVGVDPIIVPASCPTDYTISNMMCTRSSAEPSCPEGTSIDESGMCVYPTSAATCEDPERHVDTETGFCVFDTVDVPQDTDDTQASTTPVTHESHSVHHKTSGQVLGASIGPDTSCTPLITQYLWAGKKDNDPEQVKALQTFLNGEMGTHLAVSGVFGADTTQVVRDFQLKYWQDVLAPWVKYGLKTDHTTSGLVFKLTQWKINSLHCAPVAYLVPPLP